MPDTDVVLMIRPLTGWPALACSRQWATAKWVGANVPLRWTLMTASHSSSVMLARTRSRRMPALLTSTWTSPKVSMAVLDQALRAFPVGHAVAVGDGLAAGGHDLVDDLLGGAGVGADAVGGPAEVVHDHLGAVLGEHQGVLPADARGRRRSRWPPGLHRVSSSDGH